MATNVVTVAAPATQAPAQEKVKCNKMTKSHSLCQRYVDPAVGHCIDHSPEKLAAAAAKATPTAAGQKAPEVVKTRCLGKAITRNNEQCETMVAATPENQGLCWHHQSQKNGAAPKVPASRSKAKAKSKGPQVDCAGICRNGEKCGRKVTASTDPTKRAVCFSHPEYADPNYTPAPGAKKGAYAAPKAPSAPIVLRPIVVPNKA